MDSFSSIGILLQTKPEKKKMRTQEIHGVNKVMEKSTQSPPRVKEFSGGSGLALVHALPYEQG